HYDRRWSRYVQASIRETPRRLDLAETGRLLDVGCGTGSLLQAVAARHRRADLAGVDSSAEMLMVARGKLADDVSLRQGRAEALPFADNHFNAVISTSALHFCRRPADALKEMQRVLRPGGRMLITDWCDDYWTCKFCNVFLRIWSPAHYRTYT